MGNEVIRYKTRCPNCGAHIDDKFSRFCSYCGTFLAESDVQTVGQSMNETLNEMDDSGIPVRDVSFIPAKTETTLRAAGLLFLVIGIAALAAAAGLLIRLVLRLTVLHGGSLAFYIVPVLGTGFFGGIFTFFGRMMYKPYSDIDKARRRLRSGSGVRLINGTVRSYEDDMSSTINGSGHYQILSIRIIEDGQPVILRCGTMDIVRNYAIDETVTLRTDGTVYEIV